MDNLVAGFRASGLFPLDRTQVLKRLPSEEKISTPIFNDALVKILRENCGVGVERKSRLKRGAKVSFKYFAIKNSTNGILTFYYGFNGFMSILIWHFYCIIIATLLYIKPHYVKLHNGTLFS